MSVLASRGDPIRALTDQGNLPLVTAAPVLSVDTAAEGDGGHVPDDQSRLQVRAADRF